MGGFSCCVLVCWWCGGLVGGFVDCVVDIIVVVFGFVGLVYEWRFLCWWGPRVGAFSVLWMVSFVFLARRLVLVSSVS
jgi:hypothetical protein